MQYRDFLNLLDDNDPGRLLLAGCIAGGLLAMAILIRFVAKRRYRDVSKTDTDIDDLLLDLARRTKIWLLLLPFLFLGARALILPRELARLVRVLAALSITTQGAMWGSGIVDFWLRRYRRRRGDDPGAVMTVNMFRVAIVSTVWIIAALVAIDNLGFNITTLIAGLGIGGVAVALALQNILGDLFASLSIAIDKPFVIGDPITVEDLAGTVEQIGLKTTRVRSVNGEEIVFANGDLLKSRIRNFRHVQQRRASLRFGVVYNTTADQLARIPLLVRAAVEKQPNTRFDHAHFTTFGESAYEFEAVYFVLSADQHALMDAQQAVNLDIVRAFADAKIEMAFPTRTVIMARN